MKTCPCGWKNKDSDAFCEGCLAELVPEPARPSEGSVTCSEWVEELEAALSHVGNALDKWPDDDRGTNYQSALIAGTRLLNAINSERSRSSTEKLNDRDGGRS